MEQTQIVSILIGLFVIALGFSFAYKTFQACVFGKVKYWQGFLPLTLVSPLFVHLPSRSKNTLIREKAGLWVHFIVGPIFLFLSALCIAIGADLMGLPGIDSLNFIINGGNRSARPAVVYDKKYNIRFPFIARAAKKFGRLANKAQFDYPLWNRTKVVENDQLAAEEAIRKQEANREDD